MPQSAFRSLVVPAAALLCLSGTSSRVNAQPLSEARLETDEAPAARLDCSGKPTDVQKKILGARFLQAWICRTSGVFWNFNPVRPPPLPPTWNQPFPPTNLNGYGCYCGSGSTGLDTKPVDGYDECCRQHDIDWTAICQTTPDPANPAVGCDCYVRIPPADGCVDKKLTFPKPKDPNPCADKCAAELNKQFDCYAKVHEKTGKPPDLDKYRNRCAWEHYPNPSGTDLGDIGPGSPFDLVPAYCQKSDDPIPPSDFEKPDQKVDPGENVHFTCTCTLVNADCSAYVTGCARSATHCQNVGGFPGQSCYDDDGGCEPTIDVTAASCPYRAPWDPCDEPVRPLFCGAGLQVGDACNPLTGGEGEGGTCQGYGEDIIACLPGAPDCRPPVIDAVQAPSNRTCVPTTVLSRPGAID